jgi:hypothetical protein
MVARYCCQNLCAAGGTDALERTSIGDKLRRKVVRANTPTMPRIVDPRTLIRVLSILRTQSDTDGMWGCLTTAQPGRSQLGLTASVYVLVRRITRRKISAGARTSRIAAEYTAEAKAEWGISEAKAEWGISEAKAEWGISEAKAEWGISRNVGST